MQVSINKYVDILLLWAGMTFMLLSLMMWANIQRHIFKEFDGSVASGLTTSMWAISMICSFAMVLLKSGFEVFNKPVYFWGYVGAAVIVFLTPILAAPAKARCVLIEEEFKKAYNGEEGKTLPKKADYFIKSSHCSTKTACTELIEKYVEMNCTKYAGYVLSGWGIVIGVIVAIVGSYYLFKHLRRRGFIKTD